MCCKDRPNCSALGHPLSLSLEIVLGKGPLVLLRECAGNPCVVLQTWLGLGLDSRQRLEKKGQEFHPTTRYLAVCRTATGRIGRPTLLLVDMDVRFDYWSTWMSWDQLLRILSLISTTCRCGQASETTTCRSGLARYLAVQRPRSWDCVEGSSQRACLWSAHKAGDGYGS